MLFFIGFIMRSYMKCYKHVLKPIDTYLKIEKPKDIKPLETPFEDNKATNIINENNHLEAQNTVLNDVKPRFVETQTPINRKSLDEINSNVTRYKPDEIEFDPVNFQYKTDVDASGVSQKLKNVTEWDEPSAGTIVVYEFKNGKKAVVDGHQRLGLAKRLSTQGKKIELLSHHISYFNKK